MSKIAVTRQHKIARTGSYGTRLSATGKDTLGYGAGVWQDGLSPEEEREVLLKRKEQLIAERKAIKPAPRLQKNIWMIQQARYDAVGEQIKEIDDRLAELRPLVSKAKGHGQDLGHYLIAIFKSRVSRAEWLSIVADAEAMYEKEQRQLSAP